MRISFEGIPGLSEFWLSQKIGLQKGSDPTEARVLSGLAKGLRGPGLRKGSDFVLSQSLLEKLDTARKSDGSESVTEQGGSVPVPRLSDPPPVDWDYLRRRIEERAEEEAQSQVEQVEVEEESEEGTGESVEEVGSGEGGEDGGTEETDVGETGESSESGEQEPI